MLASPPPCLYSLHKFHFHGVTKYLEDLVTFIDTPQLNYSYINHLFGDFDTPRLAQFINRASKFSKRDVHVQFHDNFTRVVLPAGSGTLKISTSYRTPDMRLSIGQVCNSSLHPHSTVEGLYIEHQLELPWMIDAMIENTLWLQLLLPFTAVKNLYRSWQSAPDIADTLQELVGDRITEVLPSLQNIFVRERGPLGPFQEHIGQFAAMRRQSGHPIAISVWDGGRMCCRP
jgi:hypothetical protein